MGFGPPQFLTQMNGETFRIIECTDLQEYLALSATWKDVYRILVSAVVLNMSEGSKARTALWTMFPADTVTGAALRNPQNGLTPLPFEANPEE